MKLSANEAKNSAELRFLQLLVYFIIRSKEYDH